jgi:hypothetical protein
MENQEQYYEPQDTVYSEAPGTSLVRSSGFTLEPIVFNQQPVTRSQRQLAHRAELAATLERYKAQLTQEVIVNTTALSAIADQAINAVPSCEKPVRDVVNMYALTSGVRIASRW